MTGVNAVAVVLSVAVLALLLVAVVRRVVVAEFRTARRAAMVSTSADRRRLSGRLLLLAHVALGLFAVALALYLLVAAWPGLEASTTYGARLVIAWAQVATLAAASACWLAAGVASQREHHSDRRWAAEMGEWRRL